MTRTRRTPFVILALACAAVGALVLAAPVAADPGDFTVTFFNCTGPVGTPTSFTAEKTSGNGGALHIDGTNETFNRQGELDTVTGGGFAPPAGLVSSGLMVTCETILPFNGDLALIYGKIAQASP